MFRTNKSKVKRICKANGWQLFELHDQSGYWVRVFNEDGAALYEADSLYKNITYERVLNLIGSKSDWKRIV